MKKLDVLILSVILIIAFAFRLYKINIPLADLHSWRQADTAAVARNFVRNGFDLMHPIYDDLSNVQSGFDNPHGYRMVEFPIYNAIFAFFFKFMPIVSLEVWGRLTTILFSLIVIAMIYYLVLKESNRISAVFAALIYATFPFFVFFSRVILPDTATMAFALLAIVLLYVSVENKDVKLSYLLEIISAVLFAAALLTKPYAIFYLLPVLVLFYRKYKLNLVKKLSFYLYFIIALAPFIYWRFYIKQYPEGIPVSDWLFTSINTDQGLKSVFLRPSYFRWIFFERINNIILGGYLSVFFVLGLITKYKKNLLLSFFISALAYLLVFQGGNLQHEYYQTIVLPVIAMIVGVGIGFVFSDGKKFIHPFLMSAVIFVIIIFSFYFSYYTVSNYYQYSQELVQEADVIKSLTNQDDLIVTDRTGDTTLLYMADRRGAPAIFKSPADLAKLGYKYLVTSSDGEIKTMKTDYDIIFQNEKFTIFKL